MKNPYIDALQLVGAGGSVIGAIVAVLGGISLAQVDRYGDASAATLWTVIGAGVLSIGLVFLVAWLVAAAVTWRATEPRPSGETKRGSVPW